MQHTQDIIDILRVRPYSLRSGAGATTTSASPVFTSYTSPEIIHEAGSAVTARNAARLQYYTIRGDNGMRSPST